MIAPGHRSANGSTEAPGNSVCHLCGTARSRQFISLPEYSIVQCDGCGLRYLDPLPTPDAIAEWYAEGYFTSDDSETHGYSHYTADAQNLRLTFEQRIRELPEAGRSRRLLDVGAAAGFFVEVARAHGWDAQGVEPSEWAAEYARGEVGQPVTTGTLEEVAFPADSFDVVTLWEVIEHLPDPRGTLLEIARVVREGGYLFLTTPDAGSLVARLTGRRWLGWRKVPEHLFFFDRSNLTRLLNEVGFDVVRHRHVPLYATLGFALDRLFALLGLGRASAGLPRWVRGRSVRVNPGYDLLIVARLRPHK